MNPQPMRPPTSPWLNQGGQPPVNPQANAFGGGGSVGIQGGQPSQPLQGEPHPLFQGRDMAHQLPPTPHSGATHQLLQHAVPIFHQMTALKKAMGNPKAGNKNNPAGMEGWG